MLPAACRGSNRFCPTGDVYCYAPENCHLHRMFSGDERYVSGACYLLDRIILNSTFHAGEDGRGFVPLSVRQLEKVVPAHIERRVRHGLVANGVIECNRSYQPGVRSTGYRLAAPSIGRFRRHLITYERMANKLKRLRKQNWNQLSPVHRHLTGQYQRVTIASHFEVDQPDFWQSLSLLALDQLAQGDWGPVVCDYGRFHCPLTRMSKEFRPGLLLDGRRLVEVDIVNSQPFFLALLIRLFQRRARSSAADLSRLFAAISPHIPEQLKASGKGNGQGRYMCEKNIESYQQLTSSGQFYEAMAKTAEADREQVKKAVFRDVLFGRNQIDNPLKRSFTCEFPAVAEFVAVAKQEDYCKLAHMLQRLESYVVIDQICGRLMRDCPGRS